MDKITSKLNTFKSWFSRALTNEFFKHILIVLLFLVLIVIGNKFFYNQANQFADEWLGNKEVPLAVKQSETDTLEFAEIFTNDNPYEKRRLQQQFKVITARAELHLNVVRFYYARYYMAIIMTAFCGIVSAICLLLISKSGWLNTSRYVITIFLVSSSFGAFFGSFPKIFKQKSNIDDNKRLFLAYSAMANRILSYTATGEDVGDTTKTRLKKFIHKVDKQLEEFYTFPIELDPSELQDIKKVLDHDEQSGDTLNTE
jgi:hypothetical protein